MTSLINTCFPVKTVSSHSKDKPWVTSEYKQLIKERQRAKARGETDKYRTLRNRINRKTKSLRSGYYKRKVEKLYSSDSRQWWNNVGRIIGANRSDPTDTFSGMARDHTGGDFEGPYILMRQEASSADWRTSSGCFTYSVRCLTPPQQQVPAVSVSDCLTEEARMVDVQLWLRKVTCDKARPTGATSHLFIDDSQQHKSHCVVFRAHGTSSARRPNNCNDNAPKITKLDTSL